MIFSRESVHTREVIYSLVRLHFVQALDSCAVVRPHNIPLVLLVVAIVVIFIVGRQPHVVQFSSNISNYVILRLCYIHH